MNIKSLSELQPLGHDILINATGVGSASLLDFQYKDIQMIRGQTLVVKHNYDKAMQRDDGVKYTYAIPWMDGTVILGGVRQHRRTVLFSKNLNDYEILGHNVGVRPARSAPAGIRLEKETKDGQEIVHAYVLVDTFILLEQHILCSSLLKIFFCRIGLLKYDPRLPSHWQV
ncbi:unnamed protein product [Penicillium manginii]